MYNFKRSLFCKSGSKRISQVTTVTVQGKEGTLEQDKDSRDGRYVLGGGTSRTCWQTGHGAWKRRWNEGWYLGRWRCWAPEYEKLREEKDSGERLGVQPDFKMLMRHWEPRSWVSNMKRSDNGNGFWTISSLGLLTPQMLVDCGVCPLLLTLYPLSPGSQKASKVPGRMAVTEGPSVRMSQGLGSGALNEPINGNQETNLVSTSNLSWDLSHFFSLGLTLLWVTCILSQVLSRVNKIHSSKIISTISFQKIPSLFFHSKNIYWEHTYSGPGEFEVLGTANKTDQDPCLHQTYTLGTGDKLWI